MKPRLRPRDDQGMTLIELLVAMGLLVVVSTLVVLAVSQSANIMFQVDDENEGLQDAKVILDRLGRDIREARGVYCDGGLAELGNAESADPDCQAHLQLWIDDDSDYLQQDSEVVTWRLRANGEHYDVLRYSGLADVTGKVQASSLVVRTLFTYNTPAPGDANQVTMEMKYDALLGRGVDERQAAISARLRNKG